MLKNVLEWCFKNTNILDAKDNNYNEGERFIHFAAKNGYVSIVKQLIVKGEINAQQQAAMNQADIMREKQRRADLKAQGIDPDAE